jgi:WD40 repeat protein
VPGLQTWNMQTSAQQSLSGPKGQVHALAVSEDGLLFAGTQDGTILEWKFNAINNSFEPAASLSGHSGPVITLLFIGNRLYSGSMDKSIRVCCISTYTLIL